MQQVKIKKGELLEKIKVNRENHRAIFLEAQKNYRQAVIDELDKMQKEARDGKRIRTHVALVAPMDQTREYDTVIAMLEMSVDDDITLTSREFSNYVRDDWAWKESFLAANMTYSENASRQYEMYTTDD